LPNGRVALLERLRRRLAAVDPVLEMALLGVLTGVLTGAVMLLFRAAIELPLDALLPGSGGENFESLAPTMRAVLVIGGALLVGLGMQRLRDEQQSVGVVHVIDRMERHGGRLPWQNAAVQFLGGAIALLTGQSGGREGPAIHLGAAVGSLGGQHLGLPDNSIRTLVACGTAAAIAGSFNTPVAGVVFAMEVVMMEYTITSFVPVILAAVVSTLVSQAVFGDHTAFVVPEGIRIRSLIEYPIVAVEGFYLGALASAFLAVVERVTRLPLVVPWQRIAVAGLATGCVSLVLPQVMGIGYGRVELALVGAAPIAMLAVVGIAKLFVSALVYGLRVPVGVIGPTLVVGACAGAAFGAIVRLLAPSLASDVGIYVMLGMGAMMAAVLQAPLAALIAVVELTGTPNVARDARDRRRDDHGECAFQAALGVPRDARSAGSHRSRRLTSRRRRGASQRES